LSYAPIEKIYHSDADSQVSQPLAIAAQLLNNPQSCQWLPQNLKQTTRI